MARNLKGVDATSAADLMKKGALMVDVREGYEYANARIPGSHNAALSSLETSDLPLAPGQSVVFLCASGNRTSMHAARLAAKANGAEAYVMSGGIGAWARAGLPVERGGAEAPGGSRPGFFSRLFG
jgi:rhodanese-related sulfurtransferase